MDDRTNEREKRKCVCGGGGGENCYKKNLKGKKIFQLASVINRDSFLASKKTQRISNTLDNAV
jgi:hypothetical protein